MRPDHGPDLPDLDHDLPDLDHDLIEAFGAQLGEQLTFWRAQDPDPATLRALDESITAAVAGDDAARSEIVNAFAASLEFGTAGLRGALGPGPNRMNRVVVSQAAAGLATYLRDQGLTGSVIIGHDARHNSQRFAQDSAEILAAAGFTALLIDRPVPTPVVAFGIRHLDCVAGVVVTASHNPAQDNGYKVYLGDGSQIVPPADAEIATRIGWVARHPLGDIPRSSEITMIGAELLEAYQRRLCSLVPADAPRGLSWVYTPLHGVGAAVVEPVLAELGFEAPHIVEAQHAPDPDFPTVSFPNPEEAGALDLALAAARERGADLVIANDPDADRCAVAIEVDGEWRMLTGDELGVLLADDALVSGVQGTYACSIVSGSLLSAMAADHDQPFAWTLTGFKWIGRVPGLAFGYEEAIGYCCDPAAVRDKDGISALIRVLGLATRLKAEGSSIAEHLESIARRYGRQSTAQLSFRVEDLTMITEAMRRLRAAPPETLAGEPVALVDLAGDSVAQGGPPLPPTDGLLFTGSSVKVVVRPSGTEPKLKCYLEVRTGNEVDAASAGRSADRLARLRAEMNDVIGL